MTVARLVSVVEVGAAAAPRTSAPTCNAAEQRMKKPTIVVNCLAFPHELTGAELELETREENNQ